MDSPRRCACIRLRGAGSAHPKCGGRLHGVQSPEPEKKCQLQSQPWEMIGCQRAKGAKLTLGSTVVNTVSSQAKRSIVLFSREDVTAAPTDSTTSGGRGWR